MGAVGTALQTWLYWRLRRSIPARPELAFPLSLSILRFLRHREYVASADQSTRKLAWILYQYLKIYIAVFISTVIVVIVAMATRP